MEKVEFPAVFVLSARRTDLRSGEVEILAYADVKILQDDREMGQRMALFRQLEETGGPRYTYTLSNVDDVERVIAEQRAWFEAEAAFGHDKEKAGDAGTSPAPTVPPVQQEKPSAPHYTTDGDNGQGGNGHATAALVIRYKGMAPWPDKTGTSGRLVRFEWDGEDAQAPAHSIKEARLWLEENGYTADYTAWRITDRANDVHGQERREVYRRNGHNGRPKLAPVDYRTLPPCPHHTPDTPDAKARRLAQAAEERQKAAAGQAAAGDRGSFYIVDPWYRRNGDPCDWAGYRRRRHNVY